MPTQSNDDGGTYRLHLTLANVEPPIWRRLEVPGTTMLDELHRILQAAMGWTDSHLHMFEIDGRSYSAFDPDDPWDDDVEDECDVSLAQAAPRKGASFVYTYDMGDDWEHLVEIEAIEAARPKARFAVCLDGARSCPPEDCGGPWGYQELLEALDDDDHPDHEDMLGWLGDSFDPEEFDIDEVNDLLRKIR